MINEQSYDTQIVDIEHRHYVITVSRALSYQIRICKVLGI